MLFQNFNNTLSAAGAGVAQYNLPVSFVFIHLFQHFYCFLSCFIKKLVLREIYLFRLFKFCFLVQKMKKQQLMYIYLLVSQNSHYTDLKPKYIMSLLHFHLLMFNIFFITSQDSQKIMHIGFIKEIWTSHQISFLLQHIGMYIETIC